MKTPTLLVLTGPTASGKTALAIELARKFKTHILSADSRQFYREMTIGTAKPGPHEQKLAPHHFINTLSITEDYNAGRYETDSLRLLEKLFKDHPIVIMTGGSGLYIRAVCHGFDKLPEAEPELRAELEKMTAEELRAKLKILDPEHYSKADLSNPHRLVRALEVCLVSGKPYSSLRKSKPATRAFRVIQLGLDLDRKELYRRIDQRVLDMVSAGLEDEVRSLLPYRHLNALNTVGYKEWFDYFDEKNTRKRTIELIQQNTRNFAKRQMTWFRKDREIVWIRPEEVLKNAERIMET